MTDIDIPPLPEDRVTNRLLWLRDKLPAFPAAHDSAERAQIHAEEVRAQLQARGAVLPEHV